MSHAEDSGAAGKGPIRGMVKNIENIRVFW